MITYTYEQRSGKLFREGIALASGYSGKGPGRNNPAMQELANVGPIPCGTYTLGKPYNSLKVGPLAIPLKPQDPSLMFGRSAFLVHGDSRVHPGAASEGCIIMPPSVRTRMIEDRGAQLVVVSGEVAS